MPIWKLVVTYAYTEGAPASALAALHWMQVQMDRRYRKV